MLYPEKNIEDTDTLIFDYKNNVIGFEFTALDYTKPDMIKYAFRLKGFEEQWNQTTYKDRFARYTNLSAGKYVLQIKATNGDGVWSPYIKELVIIIESPIWLTAQFWIITVFLVILFGFVIYKIRTNILIEQKRQLEAQVAERTEEIRQKNHELKEKYEELITQEEEIREQATELQNLSEQLKEHNKQLSEKVKERTFELEKALDKAENAQKLVSEFLANLSHEIRTPMNAIMGFAQIIGNTELEDTKREEYTAIIEQNVQTLLNQIDSIIDVSRLHTHQYQFKNIVFSLNNELMSLYNDFKLKIELSGKNNKLILNTKKTLQLNADIYSFNKIIFHLLDNAVKYTDNGTIEFGYSISENQFDENKIYKIDNNSNLYFEFFVKDTGIGISEQQQQVIFEAFQKVEDEHKKLYRGIGLGLTLVKSLVISQSGSIHLESKQNKGTEFSIKFPISEI